MSVNAPVAGQALAGKAFEAQHRAGGDSDDLVDLDVVLFRRQCVGREVAALRDLHVLDVGVAMHRGKVFSAGEILNFPADPLLWVLLAQAMRISRSVERMGAGWISRCYGAFSAGIFLILVGDVMIWATVWGYLPWPWSALGWFVWIPAAVAFALAPLYQWEAMRSAESS